MSNGHYWIGDNTQFTCKNCQTSLSINFNYFGGQYNKSYTYIYPNGNKSTIFVDSLKDICPVEWDLGKWLPGAVEIPLSHVGLEIC